MKTVENETDNRKQSFAIGYQAGLLYEGRKDVGRDLFSDKINEVLIKKIYFRECRTFMIRSKRSADRCDDPSQRVRKQ